MELEAGKIGHSLFDKGHINKEWFKEAAQTQIDGVYDIKEKTQKLHARLGTVLIMLGHLTRDHLCNALSDLHRTKSKRLWTQDPEELLYADYFPRESLLRDEYIPLHKNGSKVTVMASDPLLSPVAPQETREKKGRILRELKIIERDLDVIICPQIEIWERLGLSLYENLTEQKDSGWIAPEQIIKSLVESAKKLEEISRNLRQSKNLRELQILRKKYDSTAVDEAHFIIDGSIRQGATKITIQLLDLISKYASSYAKYFLEGVRRLCVLSEPPLVPLTILISVLEEKLNFPNLSAEELNSHAPKIQQYCNRIKSDLCVEYLQIRKQLAEELKGIGSCCMFGFSSIIFEALKELRPRGITIGVIGNPNASIYAKRPHIRGYVSKAKLEWWNYSKEIISKKKPEKVLIGARLLFSHGALSEVGSRNIIDQINALSGEPKPQIVVVAGGNKFLPNSTITHATIEYYLAQKRMQYHERIRFKDIDAMIAM